MTYISTFQLVYSLSLGLIVVGSEPGPRSADCILFGYIGH